MEPLRCSVPGHGTRCRYAWERSGKRRYRVIRHRIKKFWRVDVT